VTRWAGCSNRLLDAQGYLRSIEECREEFPRLDVVTGVEVGEPHWHQAEVTQLVRTRRFERVLGSLHCLRSGTLVSEMPNTFRQHLAADVVRPHAVVATMKSAAGLSEEVEDALPQPCRRLFVVLGEEVFGAGIDEKLRSGHGRGELLRNLVVLVGLKNV
jgi:histidinol-phosphatase (PHP family)